MVVRKTVTSLVVLAAIAASCGTGGAAQPSSSPIAPRDWHDAKCARYRAAWSSALTQLGPQGLGRAFLDRHAAFLASNCTRPSDVCPRSAEELALANRMVVMSMNFGAASTFAPFYCR